MQKELLQRDLNVLWHPCTQMKDHEQYPLIPIQRGEGVWLYDFDGRRYLDAISSWWVNIFGHANPAINEALRQQADQLEHVIFAGFSHEPAVRVAERLVELTPPGLERVFLTDNGSSAVEIALKMSFHYWQNLGQQGKTDFVSLTGSYHGETFGALAVGDVPLYKQTYEPLLMKCRLVESPDCFHRSEGEGWREFSLRKSAVMEQALARHHDSICAVIVEPLIQCAGHMRMYDPSATIIRSSVGPASWRSTSTTTAPPISVMIPNGGSSSARAPGAPPHQDMPTATRATRRRDGITRGIR